MRFNGEHLLKDNTNLEQSLENFETILLGDPKSKIFAPLAEGYRKLGRLDKALGVALEGVAKNPQFAGGKVALARVFIDLGKLTAAEKELKEVVTMDFENLLSHKLLGEVYLKQKKALEALDAYKSALLSNPNDQVARKMVTKLETLSAADYDPSFFSSISESETKSSPGPTALQLHRVNLNSALSYLDALIVRNEYKEAKTYAQSILSRFPGNPEILKRIKYLDGLKKVNPSFTRDEALSKPELTKKKLEILSRVLRQIDYEISKKSN